MRILALLVLVFGTALAGGGIYYASVYMEMYKAGLQQQAGGVETQRVLVAKKQLRYGHRVAAEDLSWVDWPKRSLPKGIFTSRKELFGEKDAKPRVVLRTIEAGEPLMKVKLSGFGVSTRLAAQLPEGKRAYTVPIDDTGGAGFITPGDRVDVILTRTTDGELASGVIMQDLPVIAVDRDLDRESSRSVGGTTATIEVTTEQAQKLILAQRVGTLTLMLRGVNETTVAKIDPVDTSDIDFRLEKPTIDGPEFGTVVRVRRGTSLGQLKVEDSPEELARKRQQLEAAREQVAEELRRLEEQEEQQIN